MQESVFNALTVVDSPSAALALTVGDFFLFSDGTPGVNSQQNRSVGDPGMNRITYYQRIEADRTSGPHSLSPNILENSTQQIQPVSAGGPFPPSAGAYEVYQIAVGDPCVCDPTAISSETVPATTPIPFTDIYLPEDGVLKGQGRVGYVRVYDILE